MSRSTTSTTTYNLVKYSRSNTNGRSEAEQEWQHFTNPILSLVVDAKKMSDGQLESLRTRVVWALGASNDSMDVDQREVVFEDLDMHVLSLTPPVHGLPLKAVYRDTVVGVRYMHPRTVPSGSTPTTDHAAAFIDSIKLICPCRANSGPGGRSTQIARTTTMPTAFGAIPASAPSDHAQTAAGCSVPPKTPTRRRPTMSQTAYHRTPGPLSDAEIHSNVLGPSSEISCAGDKLPALTDRLQHAYMPSQSHPPQYTQPALDYRDVAIAESTSQIAPPPPASVYTQSQLGGPPAPSQRSQPCDDFRYSRPSSAGAISSTRAADYSGEPYSDLPQSRSDREPLNRPSTDAMLDPAPVHGDLAMRAQTLQAVPTHAGPSTSTFAQEIAVALSNILSALEETRSIYNLSRGELEDLVAKVVREDGFAKLLEKVDSMWAIKECLGQIA
ncbi:hypothetical protein EVJ58_g3570 [Rhodofomes roseus]|uniref:Uncharacterized protein n=1 Tax=Rhodofomes roseus TaxID=34475 RepID=A0A4Y9YKF5_9APHY|nr:hypothetical protein EVJ58_g3570 [Rhodofomes roseus]